jgi:hypothetical protein
MFEINYFLIFVFNFFINIPHFNFFLNILILMFKIPYLKINNIFLIPNFFL